MTSPMRIRQLQLEMAVDGFIRVHDDWVDIENAPDPTARYWDTLRDLIDLAGHGDVPEESRELVAAIARMRQERAEHDQHGGTAPHQGFWEAFQQLRGIRDRQKVADEKPFYIEPMKVLHAQGVPHEQIARMYGFTLSSGRGDASVVQKELDNPGSVVGPDWKHPEQLAKEKRREEARQALDTLRSQHEAESQRHTYAGPGEEIRTCPETPQELFEQGVTEPQAAKMLGWPLEKVEAQWKAWSADPAAPLIGEESKKGRKSGGTKRRPVGSDPTPDELDEEEGEDDSQTQGVVEPYENTNREVLIAEARERGIQVHKDARKDVVIAKLRALDEIEAAGSPA